LLLAPAVSSGCFADAVPTGVAAARGVPVEEQPLPQSMTPVNAMDTTAAVKP
jgi:hypothetical protein